MRVKLPIAGAAFVGAFAVISYVLSKPNPEAGVVVGLIAVTALVVIVVLVLGRYADRTRAKP